MSRAQKLAFYAPMKSPDYPKPSGDRRIGQLFLQALNLAGFDATLACRLRAWDNAKQSDRAQRLAGLGQKAAGILAQRWKAMQAPDRPKAWFSYHLYHKAPDYIGPWLCREFGLPYILAEASYAPKQAGGKFDFGHRVAEQAIRQADLILALNKIDMGCVQPLLKPSARLHYLPPFVDISALRQDLTDRQKLREAYAVNYQLDPSKIWLIATGMMRDDAKSASFRMLLDCLKQPALAQQDWQLILVGDGVTRPALEEQARPIASKCRFVGALPAPELSPLHHAADLFVWPALKEAFGMAIIEAQAVGLPVLAGNAGGVADSLSVGQSGWVSPEGDGPDLSAQLCQLLQQPDRLQAARGLAWHHAEAHHGLDFAAGQLARWITPLLEQAGGRYE